MSKLAIPRVKLNFGPMDSAPHKEGGPPSLPRGEAVVLFDGYCNLCNGAVRFLIKRDTAGKFVYSALSWPYGEKLKAAFPELREVDSIVLYDGNRAHVKSTAALKIAGMMPGLWPAMKVFLLLPAFIRDAAYDLIARNRYFLFGKKETCMMPPHENKARFLNEESEEEG